MGGEHPELDELQAAYKNAVEAWIVANSSSLRARAKQSIAPQGRKSGLLRGACHRARVRAARWLAKTSEYACAISRRDASEFCTSPLPRKSEGAGNAGRPLRPQPCVRNRKAHTSVVTTVTPETPAFPAQWFTAYIALSPGTGL